MPKEFYTEKDIEDMFRRGVMSLELTENVVLTELAYEKARRLGLRLVQPGADTPPSAPVRPYLSQPEPRQPQARQASTPLPTVTGAPLPPLAGPGGSTGGSISLPADLHSRIKDAVNARLGSQVDPRLLDVIIQRVLNSTGVK